MKIIPGARFPLAAPRHVRRLADQADGPGTYLVTWDGLDSRGRDVPASVYLYRLSAGGTLLTRKMVLVR